MQMNTPTPFHYSYSFTVSLDTCYDQCSCTVRAIARYDNYLNTTDRSDECRIDIGPAGNYVDGFVCISNIYNFMAYTSFKLK